MNSRSTIILTTAPAHIGILSVSHTRAGIDMFGFAWGNNYKEWAPFMVSTDEITNEIDKAENSGTGSFYNDDTFLYLRQLNSEILFCHEYDIHLEFDQSNKVVNAIIEAWKSRNVIQGKIDTNEKAPLIFDLHGLNFSGGGRAKFESKVRQFTLRVAAIFTYI